LFASDLARRHSVTVAAANFSQPNVHPRLSVLADSLLVPHHESFSDGDVPVISLSPTLGQRLLQVPITVRAIPVLRRYFYSALQSFGYFWYRLAFLSQLRKIIREVDVVHSVAGGYLAWVAQEAARAEGKAFACTPYVHPGGYGDDKRSMSYANRSDAVFALLETDRKMLSGLGVDINKIHLSGVVPLLPESADPSGFRSKHGIGDAPMVLFVGRMVGYKGYGALLKAALLVWSKLPETQFVFVGPGGDSAADEFHDDGGRVHCLGRVSEQEKADALAACTVFCMPSIFEILPAVYLEAWSYGKPVLGGMANGLPELIEGNGAGLVSTQDENELATKLLTLLLDLDMATSMGSRGKELVEQRYSVESVVRSLETVYENIIAG
jgi:glycosyltransferase involved in cell wall biosynthesis